MKYSLIKSILITLIIVILSSCNQKQNEVIDAGNYKIYRSKNIKTITDISLPLVKEFNFSDYELRVPQYITHKKQKFYILDKSTNFITMIDDNGKLIHKFGGRGMGPGELNSTNSLAAVATSKNIIISDYWQKDFKIYDLEGNFIKKCDISRWGPKRIHQINDLCYGLELENSCTSERFISKSKICFYDSLFNISKVIYEANSDCKLNNADYNLATTISCNSDSNIFVHRLNANNYLIEVFDPNGDKIAEIQRRYLPVPTSKEEQEAIQKHFKLSKNGKRLNTKVDARYKRVTNAIACDNKNRLFVLLNHTNKENSVIDVFENKLLVKKIRLPFKINYLQIYEDKLINIDYEKEKISIYKLEF